MVKVEIYTTDYCPYCVRAKDLLKQKGIEYSEIDVTDDEDQRNKMIARANGKRTVPQIFVTKHVGGCDDLYALDKEGKLDNLLEIQSNS